MAGSPAVAKLWNPDREHCKFRSHCLKELRVQGIGISVMPDLEDCALKKWSVAGVVQQKPFPSLPRVGHQEKGVFAVFEP